MENTQNTQYTQNTTHLQPGGGGRQEWPGATTTTGNDGINNSSDRDVSQETSSPADSPAAPTKRRDKKDTTPGQRFACSRCSKTYTRIENLTRHQANHEGGKFNCPVCGKAFTRSDLLNRHRRIHATRAETANNNELSNEFPSPQRSTASYESGDTPIKQEKRGNPPESPNNLYQRQYVEQHHQQPGSGYQPPYQHPQPHDERLPMIPQAPNQGLNNLMEAALAPQEVFSFTPVENFNPDLWGGFMLFADKSNSYMGSYDADISWTLNSLHSEASPTNYLDHDPNYVDFAENPYQYQAVPYRPDDVSHLDAADAVDEDTNDWPDKPNNPVPRAPRVVPLHLLPTSWQSVLDEARSIQLHPHIIRSIQPVNEPLRNNLISALDDPNFRNPSSKPPINDAMFPPSEIIEFFLHLYIQHIHPRFSLLHLPTFDIYSVSPLLLLAMCFLGSSHSRMDRGRFSRLFYDHLRVAVARSAEMDPKSLRVTDSILTSFLLCVAGTWSGSKQSYEFAEGARGTLITTMRRARLLDCRPSSRIPAEKFKSPGVSDWDAIWYAWVETEKRKRLGLCIYMFDCQWPALFNCQPYVSKAETTNCVFPCATELWTSPSATWRVLISQPNRPTGNYYLHALNACLLHKWVKPPPPVVDTGSDFGKMVLIYAIHTHIFEWRQSTSMLNPTGLMGSFGNSALPIGKGLQERRKWLIDGLDSFGECYGLSAISPGATLLHRLAYVALDVSLSDMHLVAGRSNNLHDGNFAEENLKHWANSGMAESTMGHVYQMLELCHRVVGFGNVAECSFEVSVCLLTGGVICWAYAKLGRGDRGAEMGRVRAAAGALSGMGCWRMCSTFGRILGGFEIVK